MLLEEKLRRQQRNKLKNYQPSLKQREFHAAGGEWTERALMAGNQLGKTLAGGYEVAFHLTGLYPDWWTGLRFKKPIKMWAASVSGDLTRDSVQRVLFGESLEEVGTGTIPGHTIVKWRRHAQVKEGILRAFIRHSSGGVSVVTFKNYEQGRKKWQAETLDFLWFDEEPPEDVYSEG
jgi:phage terminase large subunit-like protein